MGKESIPEFQDRDLTCCDCGDQFLFTASEQKYYFLHNLTITKRCPKCRLIKKLDYLPLSKRKV